MSMNTLEEIKFLSALQKFTVHCVSNQCSPKIKSYCVDLLIAVKNLPKVYIGHKIQLALALETASLRNETRFILNDYMNIISHLIYLSRPNLILEEEKKCEKWTGIDLISLLNECENRFKKQSYSSTLWIEILNKTSMVSYDLNYFKNISFDFVQHDTDIEQLFQWINQNKIKISGRFNRTYGGVPLFWCTPSSSQLQSKYGSIRLIFPFSIVYSSTQHHFFDLGQRKHGSDRWHNILITTRKQIAGYGTDFIELSSIPSMPLDIAIDLTDGPLILSDVRITFVNHIDRCIPILPEKLTPQHSCYNTSHSAMENFLRHHRKSGHSTLDQLKHLFDSEIFDKLKQINNILFNEEIVA
ncbi:unnamed protein product [Rotaria sp. Silwood1]|nr:unnamed protein product [Rotaria sp. Silwood1]CAF3381257.1 unnamed protein product [Rotaria sp. Silwood1]CAF3382644.1 unnamed protein product [Rotaria sp. Silwood1]CAF4768097.1 unnamed protein product [Rotaria sp. Silwood1]CAF4789220.1 unnamed protein product [Rotaria sp. Silwood1]